MRFAIFDAAARHFAYYDPSRGSHVDRASQSQLPSLGYLSNSVSESAVTELGLDAANAREKELNRTLTLSLIFKTLQHARGFDHNPESRDLWQGRRR